MEIATVIQPGQKYIVWSASITYNAIALNPGDSFYGVVGVTTYTGAGFASEIIELNTTAIELVNEPCDSCFPEKLVLNQVSLEVIPPQNGTIFPEQLRIFSTALEVAFKKSASAQIIYSKN